MLSMEVFSYPLGRKKCHWVCPLLAEIALCTPVLFGGCFLFESKAAILAHTVAQVMFPVLNPIWNSLLSIVDQVILRKPVSS